MYTKKYLHSSIVSKKDHHFLFTVLILFGLLAIICEPFLCTIYSNFGHLYFSNVIMITELYTFCT